MYHTSTLLEPTLIHSFNTSYSTNSYCNLKYWQYLGGKQTHRPPTFLFISISIIKILRPNFEKKRTWLYIVKRLFLSARIDFKSQKCPSLFMHLLYVYLKDEKLNVEEFYFIEKIRDFFGVIFVHQSPARCCYFRWSSDFIFFLLQGVILYKMHII